MLKLDSILLCEIRDLPEILSEFLREREIANRTSEVGFRDASLRFLSKSRDLERISFQVTSVDFHPTVRKAKLVGLIGFRFCDINTAIVCVANLKQNYGSS